MKYLILFKTKKPIQYYSRTDIIFKTLVFYFKIFKVNVSILASDVDGLVRKWKNATSVFEEIRR